jgi:hypothetical protein
MADYTKVRYAVLVAVIGLGVALIPGLTDTLAEWIRSLSLVIGGLWSLWRIGSEFIDIQDPMIHTMDRDVQDTGFWATIRRAL